MSTFKKLASDTAIYGVSSIVGRLLNWFLVPYYSILFLPADFGIITNLYGYVAFFVILLTYGLETSYFRYASNNKQSNLVYSTSLISLLITSISFLLVVVAFKQPIANWMGYSNHTEYIVILGVVLALDALVSIPFAQLRLKNRPIKFATIKLINVAINIGFNLFFFWLCPKIVENNPDSLINTIYSPQIGVGYVFISNLIASIITLLLLSKEIVLIQFRFSKTLWWQMMSYGFPILIVGIAGMINQNIDKILIPKLISEENRPMYQLGIYGANYKLAVLMNMFIQAFRYAFEPFFFARGNKKNDKKMYATVMKYFVIFGLLIFLGMVLYIDIVKLLISSKYHSGLKIVPLILMANLFLGIYFTLSLWYKLNDMTRYGAYMAIIGAIITLVINILLIPILGYTASAIAVFVCFLTMMLISYFLGQKYYPVPYDVKRIGFYFIITVLIFAIAQVSLKESDFIKYGINSFLMIVFVVTVFFKEKEELLSLFKYNKKG